MTRKAGSKHGVARLAALCLSALLAFGCGGGSSAAEPAGARQGNVPVLEAAADSEAVFSSLGDFQLRTQDGRPFTRKHLLGHTWILSNIFTTCTGPCPSVTKSMAELQRRLADTDARLLSLSVDPLLDTLPVLKAYGERHDADFERWSFVTGDEAEVHALLVKDLFFATQRAPAGEAVPGYQVTHDVRLVVLDAEGRVRGYYDSRTAEGLDSIEARVRYLLAEAPTE